MSDREVTVTEIKEVLRLWLRDEMGLRPIAETAGVDRQDRAPLRRGGRQPGWSARAVRSS